MIAHAAERYYLAQPDTYALTALRKKFGGEFLIVEGKPYITFEDQSALSIQQVVRAKFLPEEVNETDA